MFSKVRRGGSVSFRVVDEVVSVGVVLSLNPIWFLGWVWNVVISVREEMSITVERRSGDKDVVTVRSRLQ